MDCRKRKIHPYEEQSSNWDPKNLDKLGGLYGRCNKQKVDPYCNQELNVHKTQDLMVESNIKKIEVEQLVMEKYQNKDSQYFEENNFVEKYDQRLQWKVRNDVTNSFQNNIASSTHEKTPQLYEMCNTNENYLVDEILSSNADCWPYDNPYEGSKKSDQGTIMSSISKRYEIDYNKEYPQAKQKRIGIQNTNSNKILESLQNPILPSKNIGCLEVNIEPLSGWVYHTNHGTISGTYTLEQLRKGLETKILPKDLPIYQV